MGTYARLADLPIAIESYSTERREVALSSEFTRVTTTVVLEGRGERGSGEDVVYATEEHDSFPTGLSLSGRFTLSELSRHLDGQELWPHEPDSEAYLDYRRWAFESAALDLALRQAGRSLGEALALEYRPVRFVVSTRREIWGWRDEYPELEFKLDPRSDWDDALIERLAATERVRVLDLKGQYVGTIVDQPPDARLYRAVVAAFPEAVIEDAALTDETREALRGAEERLSWDAPIHSRADIERFDPRWVNIKPSRFGTLERLLEAIDHCSATGITMYGGGQSELGVGRRHIQVLASLFYAQAANDVAPKEYNEGDPRPGLPQSPLPPPEAVGF
jgi:L-alanine-DL-glutamate epimerase-like enolase superfamily enzyme